MASKHSKHNKQGIQKTMDFKKAQQMGASNSVLINVYSKQVRSVLEYASVVLNSSLTKENITNIEWVQKSAFAVMLGSRYNSYEEACHKLNIDTLMKRRENYQWSFQQRQATIQYTTNGLSQTKRCAEPEEKTQYSNQCMVELRGCSSQPYHTSPVY